MQIKRAHDSGAAHDRGVDDLTGGGGAGGGWDLVINEDGTSFANWTGVAGTWSSDGTIIKNTNTAAGPFSAIYSAAKVVLSIAVIEMEIRFPTAGQPAAPNYAGFLLGAANPFTGGTPAFIVERTAVAANSDISVRPENVAPTVAFTTTIALDTWYKFRMVLAGNKASLYVDGVLLGTVSFPAIPAGNSLDLTWLTLFCSSALPHYRNIKVWTLTEPV